MIILTSEDVAQLLPMCAAIEVIDTTMKMVSKGEAELPLRSAIPVGGANRMGIMPGAIMAPDNSCFGVKLLSLFPDNSKHGLSSHLGAYVLFAADTGEARAMMDASLLTALRTAAASGVATRALAREDASVLTIIGYGEQAEHHLDAICAVRDIATVHVVGRDAAKAEAFCQTARTHYPKVEFNAGSDVQSAVAQADIICTVTSSPTPILHHAWLPEGCHVNVVGSSIPTMREVDDDLVFNTSIWVDYLPSTLAQAGEVVDLIASGDFTSDQLMGEIGSVLDGQLAGRTSADQQTVYRSLGVAAQDLMAAKAVVEAAITQGLGQAVRL
ncbi:ornithine cyclodeaminase family protein [Sulfitobacter sp.]|jgi:alanine dehydrogenase|uniref:ornithine cyclodeaminase family protein n=1 Tax=Sulfitobacter sp. TaxID=1903071 RepID=UPI003001B313